MLAALLAIALGMQTSPADINIAFGRVSRDGS